MFMVFWIFGAIGVRLGWSLLFYLVSDFFFFAFCENPPFPAFLFLSILSYYVVELAFNCVLGAFLRCKTRSLIHWPLGFAFVGYFADPT